MRLANILRNRLRSLLRRSQVETEMERELQLHMDQLVKEYKSDGMSDGDARAAALRAFGPIENTKEDCRDMRRTNWIEDIIRDTGYALRMVRKSLGFTLATVLTLAIGLGGNTALFQLLDNLVIRSLPVPEPDRLALLSWTAGSGFASKTSEVFPYAMFTQLLRNGGEAAHLIAFADLERPDVSIDSQNEPPRSVSAVSPAFFSTLGVPALIGRVLDGRGLRSSDGPVAVISDRFWHKRFAANAAALGHALTINGVPFTVIGVAPSAFTGLTPERPTDIWIQAESAAAPNFHVMDRLAPGITSEQARSRLEAVLVEITKPQVVRLHIEPGRGGYSRLRQQFGRPLMVLLLGVALILLLSCVNIATLLMARAVARQRELSVRMALGAGAGRLVRQMLLESLVLAGLGGGCGFLLAPALASSIVTFLPGLVGPAVSEFGDTRVIAFAVIVTLATSLTFGLWPAWRASRMVESGLRAGRGELGTRGGLRAGEMLVILQVALSVPLLAGTGLFARTLNNLLTVDPGFGTDHLMQVALDTRGAGYRAGQVGTLYRDLLTRIGALPGVAAVTGVRNGFLTGGTTTGAMTLPGRGMDEVTFERADVGPRFFQTMAIPLVAGRDFTELDTSPTPRRIAVSESFARRYLAGRHPIGERIGNHGELEIVAVVKDVRFSGLRQSPEPMLYFAALQGEPDRLSALEVRTADDPVMLANAVRREIESINRRLLVDIKTMQRQRRDSLAPERMLAFIASGFGVLGLVLVCVGLYGVVSRAAAQRSSEFGLRIALGSSPAGVLQLVLQDTARPIMIGLLFGILASWMVAQVWKNKVAGILYGLTVTDLPTILIATTVILAGASLAALIPAARAARSDPLVALRQE